MDNKVVIFADSTVDLSSQLYKRYDIHTIPLHIILDGKVYEDSVNITVQDIFDHYYKTKELPKTAAINVGEMVAAFRPYVEKGYEIVHISIGSSLSASYQSCCVASNELGGKIYPVDSCSLSTGAGLLAIEAAERAANGMSAKQIAEEVTALNQKNHASFVLETLEFMRAGGRCSAVAAFGANLLGLRPSIKVDNSAHGGMGVSKKYRGKYEKVVMDYIDDTLAAYDNIRPERAFITYPSISDDIDKKAFDYVMSKGIFKEVFLTNASCTISSHCGPGCIGILFMTE